MLEQTPRNVALPKASIEQASNSSQLVSINIWEILRIFQKWWWLIAAIVFISVLFTGYFVSRMTPVYRASSILEVKQQDRQIFDQNSEVEDVVVDNEFFNTQIELLKSDTLAGDIIDQFNLVSDVDFLVEEETRERKRLKAIKLFADKLGVNAIGRSRLIEVSFEHTNPVKAERITNAVTESFVTYNLERKYNATSYARDFIEDRLKSMKDTLENSERELVEYASANNLVTVKDTQGNVSPGFLASKSLIALNEELIIAKTKRAELEAKFNIANSSDGPLSVQDGQVIVDLRRIHTELTAEYMEKRAIYVPEFPVMQELQARIDYIAEQIREVDTNRSQYDALLQRLKEVSIADDIGSNLISLVDRAETPTAPFKPNLLLSLLLAGLLSTFAGTGLVFLIEMIDDRIKSPDQVKLKLGSVLMGVIPKAKNSRKILEMLDDPTSAIAEAYSSLRTNLQFSGPDGGPQVIHITSTRSGEGKSVTSLGLALRYAGLGDKVLLIDADMRLPTFKHGAGESAGLSGLLTSKEGILENVLETKYANLDLLPSGVNVPNPSEILSTYKMREIIENLRAKYNYIIVDSPPVLGLADAPILAANCDASLLVVEGAATRTPAVKSTLDRLSVSGVKVLGVILTKYSLQSKGYLNYYQYSYGEGSTNYSAAKQVKTKASINKEYMDIMS